MKLIKRYSQFIAIMPIIAVYSSGIPGINVAELIFTIFIILTFFEEIQRKPTHNKNSAKELLYLVFYLIFAALLSMLIHGNYSNLSSIMVRTTRFFFYVMVTVFISRRFFDFEIATDSVKKISVLGTFFIICQYILYYGFNYILKGFVSFIPLYTTHYAEQNYAQRYASQLYRPTSFFLEPAWFSYYAIVGLIIALFKHNNKKGSLPKKDMYAAIFITIGIVLSTSAQGLFMALMIWIIWFYKNITIKITHKKLTILVLLFFLIPVVLPSIYKTDLVQSTIIRLTNTSESSAFIARFGGFRIIKDMPIGSRIIGTGFGNVPEGVWLPSAAYMLYSGGIMGFLIMIILFFLYYQNNKNIISRLCTIVFFIMFFGAAIFNNYMFVFYFSFICFPGKLRMKSIRRGIE